MLIVIGGMATSWKHIRAIFYTLAAACILDLVVARFYASTTDQGRLSLDASGTIGNSNDLAAHIILLLPFILYIAMDSKRNALVRAMMLLPIAYGILLILETASRGGMVALGVASVFLLWRASMVQRMMIVVGLGVALVAIPALLPASTALRLTSLFN